MPPPPDELGPAWPVPEAPPPPDSNPPAVPNLTPSPPPFSRLTALFEVVLCSDFPTQLLLIAIFAAAGFPPQLSLGYVWMLSMMDAMLLIALILLFIRLRRERPVQVFLGNRSVVTELLIGLLLAPVAILIAVGTLTLIQSVAPWLRNVPKNPFEELLRTPADAALFATIAIVAGGMREELQRAFILHRFGQYLGGTHVGIVVFSIVFGLGHLIQGWDAAITTALLGAFWGLVYVKRGSMIAPAVSHCIFNLIEIGSQFYQTPISQ